MVYISWIAVDLFVESDQGDLLVLGGGQYASLSLLYAQICIYHFHLRCSAGAVVSLDI